MADIDIQVSQWRYVEVGRVVLFTHGEFADRLATVVEIIDHKRVGLLHSPSSLLLSLFFCISPLPIPTNPPSAQPQILVDGPSSRTELAVPRHAAALANVILTPFVIEKLPRGAGRGAVKKAWEKQEVEKKWEESTWAKRREQREKRRALTDFERFQVLKLRKQVCIGFKFFLSYLLSIFTGRREYL